MPKKREKHALKFKIWPQSLNKYKTDETANLIQGYAKVREPVF